MEREAYKITYENEKTYWWYQARIKILEHIFIKKIYRPDMEILNLGCGTGFISHRFSSFGFLVSLDLSTEALKFCAQNQLKKLLLQTNLVPVLLTYYNFFLFPLAIIERFSERLFKREITAENFLPALPTCLNQIFYLIFSWEKNWIERISFPFGLSLLAIAQKKKEYA